MTPQSFLPFHRETGIGVHGWGQGNLGWLCPGPGVVSTTELRSGAVITGRGKPFPPFCPSPHRGLRSQQHPQAGLAWTEGLFESMIYLNSSTDKSPAGPSLWLAGQTGSVCSWIPPRGSGWEPRRCSELSGGDSSRAALSRCDSSSPPPKLQLINDFPLQVPSTSVNELTLPRALHRGRGEERKPRMSEFPGGISTRAGHQAAEPPTPLGLGAALGLHTWVLCSSVKAPTAAKSCTD